MKLDLKQCLGNLTRQSDTVKQAKKSYTDALVRYSSIRGDFIDWYQTGEKSVPSGMRDANPSRLSGLLCLRLLIRRRILDIRFRKLLTCISFLPNEVFEKLIYFLDNGTWCCHLQCNADYDIQSDLQRAMCLGTRRLYVEPTRCMHDIIRPRVIPDHCAVVTLTKKS